MSELRIGSLCSGYEGLGLAVTEVLGGEVAWVADNDPGAATILAHRFPGVANLGDITVVNWDTVPVVDILCAGFPCQDVSAAGARAGLRAGTRSGLWLEIVQAIRTLRPAVVVIENVRGLLTARGDEPTAEHLAAEAARDATVRLLEWLDNESNLATAKGDIRRVRQCAQRTARVVGLRKRAVARCQWHERRLVRAVGTVLGSLADLGFDAEGTVVSASDNGAPHRRERVIIIAWLAADANLSSSARLGGRRGETTEAPAGLRVGVAERSLRSAEDPDSAVGGEWRQPAPGQAPGRRPRADAGRPGGAHADCPDFQSRAAPTPAARDWKSGQSRIMDRNARPLNEVVEMLLPTPIQSTGRAKSADRAADEPGRSAAARRTDWRTCSPEPNATDSQGGPRAVPERRTSRGKDHGPRLRDVAPALLPTPNTGQSPNGHGIRGGRAGNGHQSGADLNAIATLLPTPNAEGGTGYMSGSNRDTWRPTLEGAAKGYVPVLHQGRPTGGLYEPAIRRWETILGRSAPSPTEPGRTGERLSPRFVEWMMGLPEGWVTDVPGLSRNQQLHALGNGVVPQQAAFALRLLLAEVSEAAA